MRFVGKGNKIEIAIGSPLSNTLPPGKLGMAAITVPVQRCQTSRAGESE